MVRSTSARLEAVDLARGFALIGMMLVHLGPYWIGRNPPVGDVIAGGRAAPLFALLAGVALSIVHQRDPHGAGSTRATWIRAALLIVLGLWLGSFDDMPVLIILAFYGLMIVVALPFRRLSTRALFLLAVVWAVVAPVVLLWARISHAPVLAGQAEISEVRHPLDLIAELVVWGAYPAGVWFAYVLTGLAIGRLDLRRAVVAGRLVAFGAALVVVTLGAGRILIDNGSVRDVEGMQWRLLFAGHYGLPRWNDLLLVGQHTSTPLNVISAAGSAILVIGLCCLAVRLPWARLILTPLKAAGAMTLTLYTIHVLWTWRLRVDVLGDPTAGLPEGSYGDWVLQVIVLCVAATLWQRFVGKGPLEWVMRCVSVWGRRKLVMVA